jgi:hypothetical protein
MWSSTLLRIRTHVTGRAGVRGGTAASPMRYETDPRMDAYIGGRPAWQQAICREVRDLVHAGDPD